jgi:hypothetical protein
MAIVIEIARLDSESEVQRSRNRYVRAERAVTAAEHYTELTGRRAQEVVRIPIIVEFCDSGDKPAVWQGYAQVSPLSGP